MNERPRHRPTGPVTGTPALRSPAPSPLVGAAGGLALATVLNRLPRRLRLLAVAQLCAIFGAIEVGAAIHAGDRRQVAVESVVAAGYVTTALLVTARAPRRLPIVVLAHALWDASQHVRGDAVPPASWYPTFCAAFDLATAARLRTSDAAPARERPGS